MCVEFNKIHEHSSPQWQKVLHMFSNIWMMFYFKFNCVTSFKFWIYKWMDVDKEYGFVEHTDVYSKITTNVWLRIIIILFFKTLYIMYICCCNIYRPKTPQGKIQDTNSAHIYTNNMLFMRISTKRDCVSCVCVCLKKKALWRLLLLHRKNSISAHCGNCCRAHIMDWYLL